MGLRNCIKYPRQADHPDLKGFGAAFSRWIRAILILALFWTMPAKATAVTTTAAFVVPNAETDVAVSVTDTSSMVAGTNQLISTAGLYMIVAVNNSTSAVMRNLGASGNASANTSIASGQNVSAPLVTTADFTTPAMTSTVPISVTSTASMAAGTTVYVAGAGYYSVYSVNSSTTATILNLGTTGNASSGTLVAAYSTIVNNTSPVPGADPSGQNDSTGPLRTYITSSSDAYIPAGTYAVCGLVIPLTGPLKIHGAGSNTILRLATSHCSSNVPVLQVNCLGSSGNALEINSLLIDGNSSQHTQGGSVPLHGLYADGCPQLDLHDFNVVNAGGHAIYLALPGAVTIDPTAYSNQRISNVSVFNAGTAASPTPSCPSAATYGSCFVADGANDLTITNSHCYVTAKAGFRVMGQGIHLANDAASLYGNGGVIPVAGKAMGLTVTGGSYHDGRMMNNAFTGDIQATDLSAAVHLSNGVPIASENNVLIQGWAPGQYVVDSANALAANTTVLSIGSSGTSGAGGSSGLNMILSPGLASSGGVTNDTFYNVVSSLSSTPGSSSSGSLSCNSSSGSGGGSSSGFAYIQPRTSIIAAHCQVGDRITDMYNLLPGSSSGGTSSGGSSSGYAYIADIAPGGLSATIWVSGPIGSSSGAADGFKCTNDVSSTSQDMIDGIRLVGAAGSSSGGSSGAASKGESNFNISNVDIYNNPGDGISILNGAQNVTVTGGTFHENGNSPLPPSSTGGRSGIKVFDNNSAVDYVTITGVNAFDGRTSPTQAYGVEIANHADHVVVSNSSFHGNVNNVSSSSGAVSTGGLSVPAPSTAGSHVVASNNNDGLSLPYSDLTSHTITSTSTSDVMSSTVLSSSEFGVGSEFVIKASGAFSGSAGTKALSFNIGGTTLPMPTSATGSTDNYSAEITVDVIGSISSSSSSGGAASSMSAAWHYISGSNCGGSSSSSGGCSVSGSSSGTSSDPGAYLGSGAFYIVPSTNPTVSVSCLVIAAGDKCIGETFSVNRVR